MPQGKGTYGSKVGRPPKKATAKKPAAKKLSTGQRKIASMSGNPKKIESSDFKKLRMKRGMK